MSSSVSSPLPNSTPSRHASSSHTTSFPDISSLSTSSTNQSIVIDFKKKIDLLKLQLQQREKEIEKQKWENDEHAISRSKTVAELQFMQMKSNALKAVCEDLTKWIESNEVIEKERLEEIDVFYKNNIKTLTVNCNKLKHEKTCLHDKLNKANLKITTLLNDLDYEKSDKKSLLKQFQELQTRHEELQKSEAELKIKFSRLSSDYHIIQKSKSAKNSQERESLLQIQTNQLEKARRIHEDREKEYGITLSRLQNEIDYLKSEILRKDMSNKRITEISDKITLENRVLFESNADQKIRYDREMNELRSAMSSLEKKCQRDETEKKSLIEKIKVLNENCSQSDEKFSKQVSCERQATAELINAQQQIITLKKQIAELKRIKQLSSTDVRASLTEKSLRIIQAERQLSEVQAELLEERGQLENTTMLLEEMAEDMQRLLHVMKMYG